MNLPPDHVRLPMDGIREALAYHDYGTRRWTDCRAVVYHGSEGPSQGATTRYLSKEHGPNPNGVSATFTIEPDGTVYQMLGLNRVSGSIRASLATSGPRLCRTEQRGYYGYSHAKFALGDRWGVYVNNTVVSVEMGMTAAKGPTDAIIDAAKRLTLALDEVYPGIIPLAHNDFAGCYKGCPGFTTAIKRLFSNMGGHGKDYRRGAVQGDEMIVDYHPHRMAVVPAGISIAERSGGPEVAKTTDAVRRYVPGFSLDLKYAMISSDYGASPGFRRGLFVLRSALQDISEEPPAPCPDPVPCPECPPIPDTTEVIREALRFRAAAVLAEPFATAVAKLTEGLDG